MLSRITGRRLIESQLRSFCSKKEDNIVSHWLNIAKLGAYYGLGVMLSYKYIYVSEIAITFDRHPKHVYERTALLSSIIWPITIPIQIYKVCTTDSSEESVDEALLLTMAHWRMSEVIDKEHRKSDTSN